MRLDVFWRIRMYFKLLKSLKLNIENVPFHAVNRGSNPLEDAKFGYNRECQGVKSLGIPCFNAPIRFPEVYSSPVASTIFVGIFVGIAVLCSYPLPTGITY